MKKPKFLPGFHTKKKEIEKLRKHLELDQWQERQYLARIERLTEELHSLREKESKREMEERREERKRTDIFSADKWSVVYDSDHHVSKVYLNGMELYGCQRFDVDLDACGGQTPRFTYEGYGSIDISTEESE